jgi:hypothetical protein
MEAKLVMIHAVTVHNKLISKSFNHLLTGTMQVHHPLQRTALMLNVRAYVRTRTGLNKTQVWLASKSEWLPG